MDADELDALYQLESRLELVAVSQCHSATAQELTAQELTAEERCALRELRRRFEAIYCACLAEE